MKSFLYKISRNWFGWGIVGLTVVTASIWIFSTRPYFDDFIYQRRLIPEISSNYWSFNTPYIESWSELLETIRNHYLWVNGRLANLFFLLLHFFPTYIIKLICAIFTALFAFSFWWTLGLQKIKNAGMVIAYALLFWIGLQWNDSMQSSVFILNYVPTSFFMIVLIRELVMKKRKPKVWFWVLLSLFSLWHEGFTLIFLVFLLVYCIKRNTAWLWISAAILFIGLLLQLPSGTVRRVNGSFLMTMPYTHWGIMLFKSWTSIVALLLWAFFRRRIHAADRGNIDLFGFAFVASWLVMIVLTFKLHFPQRAHWPNDILSILFILLIMSRLPSIKISKILSIALLIIYSMWCGSLLWTQFKANKFTDYCVKELKSGNTIIIDEKGIYSPCFPFWLMSMIYYPWEHFMAHYVRDITHDRSQGLVIIESSQKDKPFEEWSKVPGKNDWREPAPGFYVRPFRKDRENNRVSVAAGEPTIAMSPLNYVLSGFSNKVTVNNIKFETILTKFGKDSVEVIQLPSLPVELRGRRFIAIDEQNY